MTFKEWWHNEGSQAPYTHHDCEEHCMRMCEIAWSNGAYVEREACAKLCAEDGAQAMDFTGVTFVGGYFANKILTRGEA